MTSADGDRSRRDPDPREGAPWRRGLRDWRVRPRLVALIAVPTVVAVALGAVGVGGALTGAAAYARVGTMADVAAAVTTSVGDLEAEQAGSAAFVGAGRTADRARAVAEAQKRTDAGTGRLRALVGDVDDDYPEPTRDRVRRALFRLDTLPALRSAVTNGRLPAGVTVDRYGTVVTDLLALDDEIAQEGTDPELSASVRALGALSRSRAALATQRALLGSALLAGRFEPGGDDALTQAIADQDSALQQFRTAASVARAQRYDDVVAGADVDQTSAIRDGITAGRPPTGGAAAVASWEASASGAVDKVGRVESDLVTAVYDRAGELRSDQLRQALIIGIVALAVVLIVLLATTAVARSLVLPLRALRDGALSVAERRLPDTVARLDREDPDTVDTRVEPIAVHSADEIGEVARSFDAVHQEAVRAATGEARRRAQAGALFVTLSRRTQSLVDRQIELIDDLERGEQDADRLDSLFRLDHLATRMRRNGENLLVLGGQEPVRRWNRRLGLLDVLRAALSEIEQYPRVDIGDVPGVSLAESAVSDVVHLLAELLDNATAFSSRTSRVDVAATALRDGSVLVEITDGGIGLTAAECEELGKRLAAPTEVGVDASRRMGLYVVGRLAARIGARVRLAPGSPRGVTASVTLPATVLTATPPETGPESLDGSPGRGPDGAWIGERFSQAITTPGPGADSWFGGTPLATAAPSPGSPDAGAADAAAGAASFVPTASGTTDVGLPRRRPGANEVPGTGSSTPSDAAAAPPAGASPGPQAPAGPSPVPDPAAGTAPVSGAASGPASAAGATDRSPGAIRDRYARYQRGRRHGATGPETQAGPAAGTGAPAGEHTAPTATVGNGATATGPGTTGPAESGTADPGTTASPPTTALPTTALPTTALPTTPRPADPGAASDPSAQATGSALEGEPPTSEFRVPAGSPPTAQFPAVTPSAPASDRPPPPRPAERGSPTTDHPTAPLGIPSQATTAGRDAPPAGPGTPQGADVDDPSRVPAPGAKPGTDPRGGVPAPDVPWGAGPAREPTAAGSTPSGLPLREPGANYVPGAVPGDGNDGAPRDAATDGGAATPVPDDARPAWDRSADAIRRRFAAHQEGRRRGMERTGR